MYETEAVQEIDENFQNFCNWSLENLFLYSNSRGIKELTTKETLLASGQGRMHKGRILKTSQETVETQEGQIWNWEKALSWNKTLNKGEGNHPENKWKRQSIMNWEKKRK